VDIPASVMTGGKAACLADTDARRVEPHPDPRPKFQAS
jgi:hypothetical protein